MARDWVIESARHWLVAMQSQSAGGKGSNGPNLAGPADCFKWPATEALVPALVVQNFVEGLEAPPLEVLAVLGSQAKGHVIRSGGGGGQRKRDDVLVELDVPVPLGQLGLWQEELRTRLASATDARHRERAAYVELVPAAVTLGAAATPLDGVTVVDTDAVSMLFKGDTRSEAFQGLLAQQDRRLIAFQTVAELHAWILLRHFPEAKIRRLEDMLKGFEVVWPDNLTCLLWAQLIDHGRANGRPVGAQDCWVAATALRHGATVCTCNTKDYAYLPGVRFLVPTAGTSSRGPAVTAMRGRRVARKSPNAFTPHPALGQHARVMAVAAAATAVGGLLVALLTRRRQ